MSGKIPKEAEAPLTELIKALGVDPCMLMITVVVIACFVLIYFTFKHHEKMEDKRIAQFEAILKAIKSKKEK